MSELIYYKMPDSKFYVREYNDQDERSYAHDYYVSNAIKIYVEYLGVVKIINSNSHAETVIDFESLDWFRIKLSAQPVSSHPIIL